ncbi:hypothetical protein GCM10007989_10670 [Devosia pacifica]|uniref:Uncharacterized protein n=1 Tax=Devosia pacifica TaxID=1335967 RepID=A0A918S060_9HYPH|nr:hypothetical protein GCM10007989_10670 [Devosia pacifica]
MPVMRLAIAVAGAAVTLSRNPLVRAGVRSALSNPQTRDAAIAATRSAAYNAGVLARHITGRRAR